MECTDAGSTGVRWTDGIVGVHDTCAPAPVVQDRPTVDVSTAARRITRDGAGGFILPDGTRVADHGSSDPWFRLRDQRQVYVVACSPLKSEIPWAGITSSILSFVETM